jgi:hypothetical protein
MYSQKRHRREWSIEKRDAGYRHIALWLSPKLREPIEKCAEEDMLPLATVIEKILVSHFDVEGLMTPKEELEKVTKK